MWTYEDVENLMENVTVRRKYKDSVHTLTQLLAHENYALRLVGDMGYTDEEGNYYPPTYSYQVTTAASNEANIITQFEAVPIEEGMEVIGLPKREDII